MADESKPKGRPKPDDPSAWMHPEAYWGPSRRRAQRPPQYLQRLADRKVFEYGTHSRLYESGRETIPASETNVILYGRAEGFLVSRESVPETRAEHGLSRLYDKLVGNSSAISGK
jgi:hypothetical protein